MSGLNQDTFGIAGDGVRVDRFSLVNRGGATLKVITLGATKYQKIISSHHSGRWAQTQNKGFRVFCSVGVFWRFFGISCVD